MHLFNNKQGSILEWKIPIFEKGGRLVGANSPSKMNQQVNEVKKAVQVQDRRKSYIAIGKGTLKNQPANNFNITEKKFIVNCTINNIIMGELGEIGWYLRLDTVPDKPLEMKSSSMSPINKIDKLMKERVMQPLFQFRFDSVTGRFVREMRESLIMDTAIKDFKFANLLKQNNNDEDFQNTSRKEILDKVVDSSIINDDKQTTGKFLNPKGIND